MHRLEWDYDYELLTELTEASGVPGYEDEIRTIVRRELEPHVDDVQCDEMGNVVGTLSGKSDYGIVVAAHMDEIGFMVRHVDDEGFVKLDALGGWDARVMRAQRVTVHSDVGDIPGVIGSAPPHVQDNDEKYELEVEDMHIDLGLDSEEAKDRVSVGDLVTMKQQTEVVGEHITGKALDDRVCVFAMLEAARRVDTDVTVHFAATVQEEVGMRGAQALGGDLDPNMAVALDVTVANDIPEFEEGEHITRLGEGAAIKLKDSSVITNPKVHRRLRRVAEDYGISYQLEVLPHGATDTARFQKADGATPVGAISVPTRYLHTVTESTHYADVKAVINLLTAFLETETGENDYSL